MGTNSYVCYSNYAFWRAQSKQKEAKNKDKSINQ